MRSMPPTGWNMVACWVKFSSNSMARPHVGVEQHAERNRIAPHAGLSGRRPAGSCSPRGSSLGRRGRARGRRSCCRNASIRSLSLRGQFLVERAAVDRLAEQLGDFAARIVDRLAQLDRPAVVRRRIVQQRAAAGVDLDLQRHAELAAIAEHGLMMAGEPRRPGIPVEAVVEVADLARAVGHARAWCRAVRSNCVRPRDRGLRARVQS